MITKKEIEKLANLARLKLTEEEKERLYFELSKILDYVKQLQEVKDEARELTHFEWETQKLRKDCEKPEFNLKEKLIAQFLEKKERFLKTKKVL